MKRILILLCLPLMTLAQQADEWPNSQTTTPFSPQLNRGFHWFDYQPGPDNIIPNIAAMGVDFFIQSMDTPEKIDYRAKWNFNPNQKNVYKWKDDFQWEKYQRENIQKNHTDTIPK